MTGLVADEAGRCLPQRVQAEKWQVAVGIVVMDGLAGVLERRGRRAQIRIEVLEPQYLRIGQRVGKVPMSSTPIFVMCCKRETDMIFLSGQDRFLAMVRGPRRPVFESNGVQ